MRARGSCFPSAELAKAPEEAYWLGNTQDRSSPIERRKNALYRRLLAHARNRRSGIC